MTPKTFYWLGGVGASLMSFSLIQEPLLAEISKRSAEYYLRVSLPMLLGFIPLGLALGSLYMSFFYHYLVKDEQTRETVLKTVGFFIIRK